MWAGESRCPLHTGGGHFKQVPIQTDVITYLYFQFDPSGEDEAGRLRKLFTVTQTVMLLKANQGELAEEQLAEMAESEGKKAAKKGK